MSVKIMSAVWERSCHKGSNLLVMLALADWSNDDGSNIYPSLETIAKKVRMSMRNVVFVLEKLEASGELRIEKSAHLNPNGKRTNLYFLNIPSEKCEEQVKPTRKSYENISHENFSHQARGEKFSVKKSASDVKPASPNPSLEPSIYSHSHAAPDVSHSQETPPQSEVKNLPAPSTSTRPPAPDIPVTPIHHSNEPALAEYLALWPEEYLKLNDVQKDAIVSTFVDKPLRDRVYKDYKLGGWNAKNISRMVDYYMHGGHWPDERKPSANANGNGNGAARRGKGVQLRPQVDETSDAAHEAALREAARKRIAERKAQRAQGAQHAGGQL